MSDYYPSTDAAVAALPLFAQARKTDPATSHQAARRAPVRGHAAKVLEALRAGPAGQTELAARCGITVAAVSKRLPELRRAGLVEKTGREVAGGEAEYRITLGGALPAGGLR
jgi:DNA-binding MarR family transcriptional regulator